MKFDVNERLVQLAAGVYVEEDTLRIVNAIRDYDENLRVKYLDPDSGGGLGDAPYRIVEVCPDGHERVVFGVWILDDRILSRLYAADTHKFDICAGIDANNARKRKVDARRYREEVLGEAQEMTEAILRSPKDTYTVPHPVDPSVQTVYSATDLTRNKRKTGTEVRNSELME